MIGRVTLLSAMTWLVAAAAPSSFNTAPLVPPVVSVSPQILAAPPRSNPPGFEPAPLPNRDAAAPVTRASRDASISPGLFTRSNQYRGEGLAPANSAQIEQERRALPGGGINLSMPLE